MLDLLLLRHGRTKGNLEKRYIGTTDEPLTQAERERLENCRPVAFHPDIVFVSPMKRCVETASILFPAVRQISVRDFRECDFGRFENKNYQELQSDPAYQAWIDSGGTLPFPGGESMSGFEERCALAFEEVLERCVRDDTKEAAIVAHGGTIMSILDTWGPSGHSYYDWQVPNGEGFLVETEPEWFGKGKGRLHVNRKFRV